MKNLIRILFFFVTVLVSAQDWEDSYVNALKISDTEEKPIVLVFSGSDWCAPCIKLERSIWQSEAFKSYASDNYVLYKADFPRKRANKLVPDLAEQNRILAEKFNPNGYFPLVLLVNSKEEVLGSTGYAKLTPDQYIARLNSFIK